MMPKLGGKIKKVRIMLHLCFYCVLIFKLRYSLDETFGFTENGKKYITISIVRSHFIIIFAFLRTNPGLTNTLFAGICNQDISFHPYQSNATNQNRHVRRSLLKFGTFFLLFLLRLFASVLSLVNRVQTSSV